MNLLSEIKNEITALVADAISKAQSTDALPQAEPYTFTVEIPKDTSHGDFATNAAMIGAKAFHLAPPVIAKAIVENLAPHKWIESVEIAGPFINFRTSVQFFADAVKTVNTEGEKYGESDFGKHEKVMVEYVSANPTGMMHMGNARGGAIGDCLATVLKKTGYDVTREFYVNDAGNQIEKFKDSLSARYLQIYKGEDTVPFPEDGYKGEDIKDRAKEFADMYGDAYVNAPDEERRQALVEYALPKNLGIIKSNLAQYRAEFDNWFLESELHKSGAVKEVIEILTKNGHTYEKDGALWYKATDFGAEKDEVLIRTNGTPTYFAADIAYHRNKLITRGFDRTIDIWGADHYGHVARLKGALDAVGVDGNRLEVIIMQLVRLMQNGEAVRMSKRTGRSITLEDLFEISSIDAARFFFNMRSADTHFDFDLDLSIAQTNQNPVYYVQYAHARICSIIAVLAQSGVDTSREPDAPEYSEKEERELIRQLMIFPEELVRTAVDYDVSRITKYSMDVATAFHSFYNACRVKVDDENVMFARIALVRAAKTVLENALSILKVSAPEKM